MCCETIGLALAGQKDAAQHAASFAATTQKPINIEVCVAKKKVDAQPEWKRNLLTRHKPYKH